MQAVQLCVCCIWSQAKKSAAGDWNAVKLKAIVSAFAFFRLRLASLLKATIHDESRGDTTQWICVSRPNTALPIWNNKQTCSVFPVSTPELVRLRVTTTARVE